MWNRNTVFAFFGLHPMHKNIWLRVFYEIIVLVAFVINFFTIFFKPTFQKMASEGTVKSYISYLECIIDASQSMLKLTSVCCFRDIFVMDCFYDGFCIRNKKSI